MLQKQRNQDEPDTPGNSIVKRELVEIRHEWMCNQCGQHFCNPGCVLKGLSLNEIMIHVRKMREQEFAKHSCLLH